MADYNSDRTGANIDATLDKVDALVDSGNNVTADDLNVGSIARLDSTLPRLRFLESDTTNVNTDIRNSGGDFLISTINDNQDTLTSRLSIDNTTGNVSFYEDTGTTAKVVWDASTENLSIGSIEGLPNGSLSLKTTTSGHAISLEENSGTERWQLGVNAAGDLEFVNSADSDASIVFDDSGNVGIGTASPSSALDVVGDIKLSGGVIQSQTNVSVATDTATTVATFGNAIDSKFCGIIHVTDVFGTNTGASGVVTVFATGVSSIVSLTQTGTGASNATLSVSGSNIQFSHQFGSTRTFRVSITPFSG